MSSVAQRRAGFTVGPLPSPRASHHDLYGQPHGQEGQDALEERLRDNAVTPPPDAAAFRVDFPAFLGGMPDRDRRMALYLSLGHSAKRAAARFGVTPARVTQLRQAWCRDWRAAQGEDGVTAGRRGARRRKVTRRRRRLR